MFKTEYQNHKIEILVDNARIHTAKKYNLSDFGKKWELDARCHPLNI